MISNLLCYKINLITNSGLYKEGMKGEMGGPSTFPLCIADLLCII